MIYVIYIYIYPLLDNFSKSIPLLNYLLHVDYVCLPYLTEVQFEQDILRAIHHTCTCKVNICTLGTCKKYFFQGSPSHLISCILEKLLNSEIENEMSEDRILKASARPKNQQGCLSGVILCILCNNDSAHRCGCQVTYNTIAMHSRKVKLHEIGNLWRPLIKNVFYTKEGYCIHVYFICMVCQS